MSAQKTLNLNLTLIEQRVDYDGHVELTIFGRTEGNKSHKVKLNIAPTEIGHIGQQLHEALREIEKRTAQTRKELETGNG